MFRRKKDSQIELKRPNHSLPVTQKIDSELTVIHKVSDSNQQPVLITEASHEASYHRRGAGSLHGRVIRRYNDRLSSLDSNEDRGLFVGRDIELAGEITACDHLVVEGKVAADLIDTGTIEITQTGVFCGNAEVDNADISGLFDGKLTVRCKLTVRSTGQIHGTVRYARIVIELGGILQGVIETISSHSGSENQLQHLAPNQPEDRVDHSTQEKQQSFPNRGTAV